MERVVVTGGAGFLGSHVVDALVARGNSVLVIDDLSSGTKENLPPQAQLEVCDIRSEAAVEAILKFKPNVIVHTAAQISVRRSMQEPALDSDVNVTALLKILQALKSAELPYLVFISTGGALYDEASELPWKETSQIAPLSIYGASKRAAELYLEVWRKAYGLKFVSLRPANIFGPRQNPHGEAGVVAIFNEVLLKGAVPTVYGTGLQTRDYVYVTDVVSAVLSAIERKYQGACNIGTGIETSVNQLIQYVLKVYGKKNDWKVGPAREGEVARSALNFGLAREMLAWEPKVTIEHGIEKTCKWFMDRHS